MNEVKLPHYDYALWPHQDAPYPEYSHNCLPINAYQLSVARKKFDGQCEETLDTHIQTLGLVEGTIYQAVLASNKVFLTCLN